MGSRQQLGRHYDLGSESRLRRTRRKRKLCLHPRDQQHLVSQSNRVADCTNNSDKRFTTRRIESASTVARFFLKRVKKFDFFLPEIHKSFKKLFSIKALHTCPCRTLSQRGTPICKNLAIGAASLDRNM